MPLNPAGELRKFSGLPIGTLFCETAGWARPVQKFTMSGTKFQNQDDQTGLSLWLSLLTAPLILTVGYLTGWNASGTDLLLLAISVFVAVLLSRHEGRIPLTEVPLVPRKLVIFWAVLNLGVVGGALVALAAALAGYSEHHGKRPAWVRSTFIEVACAAAGGFAFYAGGDISKLAPAGLSGNLLVPDSVLAASAAMLIAYQISWMLLSALLPTSGAAGTYKSGTTFSLVRSFAGHSLSVLAALVMYAAFNHFGDAFGLVVVPLAILGDISYRIHVRRLLQKTKEIVDASRIHLATVEALATAIDARDQVGVGHVRRTQIYAVGIGTALGLGDGDLNALRAGALLHDIGKLAVPEHILNKPGRLTSAELEKTKVHSTVGASILEKVGFPYPVVPTVKHHHEFWDGSGYPDGLSGDRIPVTARILALADAYDALRGPRPYRSAVSREDACNFLRSRAGTQFDPHVVNTFLRNLKQLEAEVEIHGFGYECDITGREASSTETAGGSYVEQIKRANQEVFSLYEMARDFGASLDLDETLSLLTRKVGEFVPYDTCLIYLLDANAEHATAAHVEGRNHEALTGKRIKVGEGATGYVLKKRKPVENVDPSLDFGFSHAEICEHYLGMASVPLLAEDKLIGAISVFTAELAIYEEEHLRLLETISRIAADAIVKSMKHAESETYALTDPLTGLPNARSLHIQFEKEVGRARRAGNALQLLMLDLDGFKAVNDTLGHKAGDTMLKDIGRLIKSELRDYDFLARYGGDEFVAIVPATDSADVIELSARIEAAIGSYVENLKVSGSNVGVSIGSASYPAQGESFEELMIAADKAMYRAKAFHKQRLIRLEEKSTGDQVVDRVIDAYTIDNTLDTGINAGGYDSGLVVELDESHIVTVNTIN